MQWVQATEKLRPGEIYEKVDDGLGAVVYYVGNMWMEAKNPSDIGASAYNRLTDEELFLWFDNVADAKQWCEMLESTGALL